MREMARCARPSVPLIEKSSCRRSGCLLAPARKSSPGWRLIAAGDLLLGGGGRGVGGRSPIATKKAGGSTQMRRYGRPRAPARPPRPHGRLARGPLARQGGREAAGAPPWPPWPPRPAARGGRRGRGDGISRMMISDTRPGGLYSMIDWCG